MGVKGVWEVPISSQCGAQFCSLYDVQFVVRAYGEHSVYVGIPSLQDGC